MEVWMRVLSGVPQGSVLGPLLFLLFINDLPDWIKSNIRMFADDTKIWTRVTAATDMQILQKDLDSLSLWSKEWLLRFNPEKVQGYARWAPDKINIHHHTRRYSLEVTRSPGRKRPQHSNHSRLEGF